jgi:hypothetical protein
MRISAVVLGAFLVAAAGSPSLSAVRISSDPGGQIGPYMAKLDALRNSGQSVVIDGPCLSACTMVLGVIPRDRLCVTPRARLGFHAAWRLNEAGRQVTSPDGTELLMSAYPQAVRDWIARRGGLSPRLMYLTGNELASMYPVCQQTQSVAAGGVPGPARVLLSPPSSSFASSGNSPRPARPHGASMVTSIDLPDSGIVPPSRRPRH